MTNLDKIIAIGYQKDFDIDLASKCIAHKLQRKRRKETVRRLLKFLTVGASGTVISLATLWLLTDLAGWHYLLSYPVAFVLSVSNNYLWNSLWTFKDKQAHFAGLGKYALVSLGTLTLREAMMYLFTDIGGMWYMASAILVTVVVCLINFILSRKFVWNKSKKEVKIDALS